MSQGLVFQPGFVPPNELGGKLFNGQVMFGTVANKSATTSTTGKMQGDAITFTPMNSTRLRVTFDGGIVSSAAAICSVIPSYGTGAAPANGDAVTGTQVGNGASHTSIAATVTATFPWSSTVIIGNLVRGTTYWFDLDALSAAGSVTITNLNYSIAEL